MVNMYLELRRLGARYEAYAEDQEAATVAKVQTILDDPSSTPEAKEDARICIALIKSYSSDVRSLGAALQANDKASV